jgi:hypothetical protein
LERQNGGGGCKGIGALSDVQDSLRDTGNTICVKRCCLQGAEMTGALSTAEMTFANIAFPHYFVKRKSKNPKGLKRLYKKLTFTSSSKQNSYRNSEFTPFRIQTTLWISGWGVLKLGSLRDREKIEAAYQELGTSASGTEVLQGLINAHLSGCSRKGIVDSRV